MKSSRRSLLTLCAILLAIAGARGDDDDGNKTFGFLAPGYTQKLWGTTSDLRSYLGGVVVLQNSDVIAAECMTSGTRLHRFPISMTESRQSTDFHPDVILNPPTGEQDGGCGMVLHPDGSLYLNTDPCPRQMNANNCTRGQTYGVVNVDPATGTVLRRFGPRGNALGIAVDPVTHHLVYAGRDCTATLYGGPKCTLYDIDTSSTPTATAVTVFNAKVDVGYIDGLYFDPSGEFIFLDNRFPVKFVDGLRLTRLTVVRRNGSVVQHIDVPSEPVGIAFHAAPPKFIATNNSDGTIAKFKFPNDDYTRVPEITLLAAGGYRGDLMQAGPDGCLYATQAGTTYDNGYQDLESNSIVQICEAQGPGFVPPPGIVPVPRDITPPAVTIAASKTELWPPNGKKVLDVISGSVSDLLAGVDLESATFTVMDSYGEIQPSGKVKVTGNGRQVGQYSFALPLEAKRAGQDRDGRTYTVCVTVKDLAGNAASACVVITVPHDQRGGRK